MTAATLEQPKKRGRKPDSPEGARENVNVRLTPDLARFLREHAQQTGKTQTAIVENLLISCRNRVLNASSGVDDTNPLSMA